MSKHSTNLMRPESYSERLRCARLMAGLTQAEVAALAGGGIAGQLVSAVECGAVERIVSVLDARLAEKAVAGDSVAHAARAQLPNVRSLADHELGLATHFATTTTEVH